MLILCRLYTYTFSVGHTPTHSQEVIHIFILFGHTHITVVPPCTDPSLERPPSLKTVFLEPTLFTTVVPFYKDHC